MVATLENKELNALVHLLDEPDEKILIRSAIRFILSVKKPSLILKRHWKVLLIPLSRIVLERLSVIFNRENFMLNSRIG